MVNVVNIPAKHEYISIITVNMFAWCTRSHTLDKFSHPTAASVSSCRPQSCRITSWKRLFNPRVPPFCSRKMFFGISAKTFFLYGSSSAIFHYSYFWNKRLGDVPTTGRATVAVKLTCYSAGNTLAFIWHSSSSC